MPKSKTSSEVIAYPSAAAERLGAVSVTVRYGEIAVHLRPEGLTHMQNRFVEAVREYDGKLERVGEDIFMRYAPESRSLATQWTLRFGIESVEGSPWETERTRANGRDCQLVKLECLDLLPGVVLDAVEMQIQRLTQLSQGEIEKLDCTSPLQEDASPDATAQDVKTARVGL